MFFEFLKTAHRAFAISPDFVLADIWQNILNSLIFSLETNASDVNRKESEFEC